MDNHKKKPDKVVDFRIHLERENGKFRKLKEEFDKEMQAAKRLMKEICKSIYP